ncbi:MAG TPA: glycosyltransferase family 1 protein [Pyrinomonadaceae bacterium]|jgi:UDP-galactopyranose mutase|nr:glycosyltransferase family 1 protein [Pyrinomonadaceae bacterium]
MSFDQHKESSRTHQQSSSLVASYFAQPASRTGYDLICLSHLRWDFVYQRPQHLLSRCAKTNRVYFVEEAIFDDGPARVEMFERDGGVCVVVPHLPHNLGPAEHDAALRELIDGLIADQHIADYALWYYTPMALGWTNHLQPIATVYDCMDELSAFRNAPRALKEREAELFTRADLVFTGGQSLYEAKRDQHHSVYAFPSSVDAKHFGRALKIVGDPSDQAAIPRPRIGFYGVIDERFDIELLHGVAAARPDWQWVVIGPVVKIDPADLPRLANIHYLGGKSYEELPSYLAGWDVAMLPFARNESTRFISPTKTPEYLAAGNPVVSTSIRDVVRPYEQLGLVRIADTVEDFIKAVEAAMNEDARERQKKVEQFLALNSWDRTWTRMNQLIREVAEKKQAVAAQQQRPLQTATTKGLASAAAGD